MKKKKKKLKFSFKKVWNSIVMSIMDVIKKFVSLPKRIKIVIFVWLGILLFLIIFIIVGSSNKKLLDSYKNIEIEMNKAIYSYMEKNEIYASDVQPLSLSVEALMENGYLDKNIFDGKTCVGYSKAYSNVDEEATEKYIVSSYINCSEYTTKGYKDNR